jgi:hypothetical protein
VIVALALGVLAGAFATADAKAKSRTVERSWVNPDFARYGIHRIAILPATTFDGDDQASNATAAVWFGEFAARVPYEWISAEKVRLQLRSVSKQRDSLVNVINDQVQKSGKVEPKTADFLARVLGVDALLCVRIDKWQVMNSASSRQTATVELQATLVDRQAADLWKVAGSAINEGPVVSSHMLFENQPHEAPSQPVGARSSGGSSSGGSSGSSGGSGGGSSGSPGGAGNSSGGSGSNSGGSSGSSGSTGSSGSGAATGWTGAAPRMDQTNADALKDLYVADLPAVYQGALTTIYTDWIPLLPPPGGPKNAPADTTKKAR